MTPTRQGSFHLFRVAGIDVYLHWSWFLVAAYQITQRAHGYPSLLWPGLEYTGLFAIVLLHELGHSLACRQTGGVAEEIILWPLGGVAYVDPPQRPGATLWSIAAGPLVNVLLAPFLVMLFLFSDWLGWALIMPHAHRFLFSLCAINFILIGFNLIPIFPLDGGQLLRSLLWYRWGRSRSLFVAAIVGMVGVVLFILAAAVAALSGPASSEVGWPLVIAVFVVIQCWRGLRMARLLARLDEAPRRSGFACSSCSHSPPIGPFWTCEACGRRFDTFETFAVCPFCGTRFDLASCLDCGSAAPMRDWSTPNPTPPGHPQP